MAERNRKRLPERVKRMSLDYLHWYEGVIKNEILIRQLEMDNLDNVTFCATHSFPECHVIMLDLGSEFSGWFDKDQELKIKVKGYECTTHNRRSKSFWYEFIRNES